MARRMPLPPDGLDMDTPITWKVIEDRLQGKPWPKPNRTGEDDGKNTTTHRSEQHGIPKER